MENLCLLSTSIRVSKCPASARTSLYQYSPAPPSLPVPHSSLPTGPKAPVYLGVMRQQNSSCFYPGTWFIGLQGMKVDKGRKTKSSVCFPLPSHGNQELRPPQGEVAGTRGRHSANRLEQLGKLWDSGTSQDWEEPLGQREVPTLLFSSLCVVFSQAMKPLPM